MLSKWGYDEENLGKHCVRVILGLANTRTFKYIYCLQWVTVLKSFMCVAFASKEVIMHIYV